MSTSSPHHRVVNRSHRDANTVVLVIEVIVGLCILPYLVPEGAGDYYEWLAARVGNREPWHTWAERERKLTEEMEKHEREEAAARLAESDEEVREARETIKVDEAIRPLSARLEPEQAHKGEPNA